MKEVLMKNCISSELLFQKNLQMQRIQNLVSSFKNQAALVQETMQTLQERALQALTMLIIKIQDSLQLVLLFQAQLLFLQNYLTIYKLVIL
jgi:hypothetical protein